MSIKSTIYKPEQFIIKDLNDGTYKVVALKSLRDKHIEKHTLEEDSDLDWIKKLQTWGWMEKENVSRETLQNYTKLRESVSRTKRVIWEYARCNKWDYFVTLTIDPDKMDRYDLKNIYQKMSRMIQKINMSVGDDWGRQKKIEYVIVPEFHKDGGVHFHGLMRGFHKTDIRINEHGYKEWRHWRDNFGYCNIQDIKDREKVCSYITKYVTKETALTVKEKGYHAFYASHGLEKAYEIYRGYGIWRGEFDYVQEDGFCKTRICGTDELASCFEPYV